MEFFRLRISFGEHLFRNKNKSFNASHSTTVLPTTTTIYVYAIHKAEWDSERNVHESLFLWKIAKFTQKHTYTSTSDIFYDFA